MGIHRVEGVDPVYFRIESGSFPKAAGSSRCKMQELRGMFVKALVVHCFSLCVAQLQWTFPGCLGSSPRLPKF